MDDAIRDQVFRPLVTTKANGMGMGLAICHSIITSHKGRIWASAALNKGTIFQFELAAHAARHTRDALAAQNPSVALLES
jgi:signal transduction histidine kinase